MNEMCITKGNIRKLERGMNMEMKSCQTHVERALDEYVAKTESYPILTKIENDENLSTKCDFCEEPAMYLVGNK
ncbi:CxxH/CxxC protein [Planomicrobium sp. YIM 101495]|uniref:CxxH/CxxC protein n=1 Tax=Planomicrobium sp. YIM 101495 TaxID=2665160 RepID=UPI00351A2060